MVPARSPDRQHGLRPAVDHAFRQRDWSPGTDGAALRVTHLGKFFHPAKGGIEQTIRSLAHAQARLGFSVRVICMDHVQGQPTRIEQDGPVEVVRVRRAASFAKIDHCPDLASVLRDSDTDLIHLHTPNPTMILGLLLSGDRRPLVVTHHSDVVKQRLRRLLFSPIERICYNRARLVLSVSQPYVGGSRVLQRYADRVAVLPIGLDLAPFLNPAPAVRERCESLKQSFPGPIWFCCGRLVYYKGIETALLALRSVPGTLLIAGDGPSRAPLERLAARLGLSGRARFLGKIPRDEDLAAYYRASEAFWFPSNARSEAFGVVQVEAMASGCPVINTAIPHSGVPWVSRHEETGLTVPVNDPEAFARAARRILDEPGLRDRLAAAAQARALSQFQCDKMGRLSKELYTAALTGYRHDPFHGGPHIS
jgi:glycosyltransferase involved in cell wall biosynthesis